MLDFDITDPSTWVNAQQAQRRPLALPPMAPQEEESTLRKWGTTALGGLGYVGGVLDKTFGGRAIRGALGGKPNELLSIIPGSDMFGLTNEEDRVGGKELLGLHGDDWGSTLAGIGAEIALDPATYLTLGGGALTKGGNIARAAAKEAGVLPKTFTGRLGTTLADLERAQAAFGPSPIHAALAKSGKTLAEVGGERLGAVAGLGLPFMDPLIQFSGPGAQAFMGGLGAVGSGLDKTLSSIPILKHMYGQAKTGLDVAGRYGRAYFDPSVMGAVTHEGQQTAREAFDLQRRLSQQARGQMLEYSDVLKQAGHTGSGADLRSLVEGAQLPIGADPALHQVAGSIARDYQHTLGELERLGVNVGPLHDEFVNFASRQQTPLAKATSGYGKPTQPLSAVDPRVEGRLQEFKNFPQGTEGINQLAIDPHVSGPARAAASGVDAAHHIRQSYLGWTPAEEGALVLLRQRRANLNPQQAKLLEELEGTVKQSDRLADWANKLDPQYAASAGTQDPLRFFGYHPLQDYTTYMDRTARLQGAAEASHNLLARSAVDAASVAGLPGYTPVAQILEQAKLSGGRGGLTQAEKLLAQGKGAGTLADLHGFAVPDSVAAELGRYMKRFDAPEGVSKLVGGLDWITNLTKAYQTALWPAFHIRNLMSGQAMNISHGGFQSLAEMPNAARLLAGEVIPGASKIGGLTHLSDREATDMLAREMAQYGLGNVHHMGRDALGRQRGATTLEELRGMIPGENPQTLTGAFSGATEGLTANPIQLAKNAADIQGVNATKDLFGPIRTGRGVGDVVEGSNRGTLYLSLRKQGYAPEEAARRTLAAHFDYSPGALTDFERTVMRRLVPFYTYQSRVMPEMAKTLAQHPGGLEAMTARAAGDLRQQEGFLPEYLGQGLAVPVGQEEGGTRRYLTKTDLPVEQATDIIKGGPNWLQNSMMAVAGQTNPLLKGPLEYATGKQFYTGRDIADLYHLTPSDLLEQTVMNSPLSRFVTTARTLADPRKYQDPWALPLNLGTGLKLSDVDMEKMRSIAGRELVQNYLRGQPGIGRFQQIYVQPGQEGSLSEDEIKLLRLNKTLEHRALQESRQKKLQQQ